MSREAMKLALEALETVAADVKTTPTAYEAQRQAITALREALVNEALDKKAENARELGLDYEPVSENFMDALKFDVAMREALAEQPAQQEPVAWMDIDENGTFSGLRYWSESDNRHEVALYTSPPAQRTWVGLTDEEVITMSRYDLEYAALIGEVERKLKEKNT